MDQLWPDPKTIFPLPSGVERLCYLKNIIKNPNIIVGDYTYYHDLNSVENFEKNVLYHFDFLGDKLIIGKFCQIAMGTTFLMNRANHVVNGFSTYPFFMFGTEWDSSYAESLKIPFKGDTVVGNDVWFGYKSTIMPGVKIGDGAIIATRSVVIKDIEPYTIVGGNPAKVIRKRFDNDTIQQLCELKWWDWPVDKITRNISNIVQANLEQLKLAK